MLARLIEVVYPEQSHNVNKIITVVRVLIA